MRYAYYPGCTLHGTANNYEKSVRAVCRHLNLELVEIEDWNCCGALELSYDRELVTALSAYNIKLAEKTGLDLMAPCSVCTHNLLKADLAMREDGELKRKVEEAIGGDYRSIKIRHFLDVILNDVGLGNIRKRVKKPLKGLKVAPYYGCLLVRPSEIARFDDPENPQSLDNLIATLDAECLPYTYKTYCCGGNLLMGKPDYAHMLTAKILREAKETGADCITLACPLCHMLLDGQQKIIEKKFNLKLEVPILYFTQLMGLAFNIDVKELGLDKNTVSPRRVLEVISR